MYNGSSALSVVLLASAAQLSSGIREIGQEAEMATQKTIVITGASQGIGAGLVETFMGRGYNVVATSRSITRSGTLQESDKLALVDGDVAEPRTAEQVEQAAMMRFGSIDGLGRKLINGLPV
jgi:NADP-dependent 3-hydroxy acid dehydrogenase YdfG